EQTFVWRRAPRPAPLPHSYPGTLGDIAQTHIVADHALSRIDLEMRGGNAEDMIPAGYRPTIHEQPTHIEGGVGVPVNPEARGFPVGTPNNHHPPGQHVHASERREGVDPA